jgi:hypothetical protein
MWVNPAYLKHEHNPVRRWPSRLTLSGIFWIFTSSRRRMAALKNLEESKDISP